MLNRAGTHRARFERHVQIAAGQPVILKCLCCIAKRLDFGVRGGIVTANGLIEAPANDRPIKNNYCANGHLSLGLSGSGLLKCNGHVGRVGDIFVRHEG